MSAPSVTIHCPSCATAFPVDPGKVPAGGVYATCSNCRRVFRIEEIEGRTPNADSSAEKRGPNGAATLRAERESGGRDGESRGGNGGPHLEDPEAEARGPDAAAAEFEEWSDFKDLSFEPEDRERELPGPGESDPDERGAMPGGDVASPADQSGRGEDPPPADGGATSAMHAARGEGGSEMDATTEVDTAGALEASSELDIETPSGADASGEGEATGGGSGGQESPPSEGEADDRPSFGRGDPHERAARLARVLASDMIAYNQEKYEQAVEGGTLATDFEEEVEKSWEEYVEQVGREMAEGSTYFQDALNEILARGDKVF